MDVMTRRRLLGGIGASGLAAALVACTGSDGALSGAATSVPDTMVLPSSQSLGAGSFALFPQADMNFQTLLALGAAGQNAEVGEVIAVVSQANAAPGGATYQALYDAMVAMGDRLVQGAAEAASAGRVVTARSRYMRAAQYYNQALYWVLGTSTPGAEAQVYRTMDAAFTAAAEMMEPAWERLVIPYQGASLPGWFMRPPGSSGRRPTLILNNGSDGQNVDMVAQGGLAALERGYNVAIFEGPGQGSQLFLDNQVFRPDWEHVITPVVDAVLARPDVDPERVALRGISFGGELCPRAAAFEHRLAALVADPGMPAAWASYPSAITKVAEAGPQQEVNQIWAREIVPHLTNEEAFTLKKRVEIYTPEAHTQATQGQVPTDWYTIARTIQQFDNTDVLGQIRCPTLVTQYQGDDLAPGAPKLYGALTVSDKRLVEFGAETGAQYHCGPMAPQQVNETIYDWLDGVLQL